MAENSMHDAERLSAREAAKAAWVPRGARLHLRVGWWSMLVFLSLGAGLEGMHLFRGDAYFAPSAETTRLMWTLAHVHGTLLGLLHVAFGVTVSLTGGSSGRPWRAASYGLLLAGILLPAGFFLGGVSAVGGDPSLGIMLVPLGALALFVAVLLTALRVAGQASQVKESRVE